MLSIMLFVLFQIWPRGKLKQIDLLELDKHYNIYKISGANKKKYISAIQFIIKFWFRKINHYYSRL